MIIGIFTLGNLAVLANPATFPDSFPIGSEPVLRSYAKEMVRGGRLSVSYPGIIWASSTQVQYTFAYTPGPDGVDPREFRAGFNQNWFRFNVSDPSKEGYLSAEALSEDGTTLFDGEPGVFTLSEAKEGTYQMETKRPATTTHLAYRLPLYGATNVVEAYIEIVDSDGSIHHIELETDYNKGIIWYLSEYAKVPGARLVVVSYDEDRRRNVSVVYEGGQKQNSPTVFGGTYVGDDGFFDFDDDPETLALGVDEDSAGYDLVFNATKDISVTFRASSLYNSTGGFIENSGTVWFRRVGDHPTEWEKITIPLDKDNASTSHYFTKGRYHAFYQWSDRFWLSRSSGYTTVSPGGGSGGGSGGGGGSVGVGKSTSPSQ